MNIRSVQHNILVFAGLDPTGGAGIQADIEAVASQHAHALPLVTCQTVQDTHNVDSIVATDTRLLARQLSCLEQDIPFHAIKLGLLASTDTLKFIAQLVAEYASLPVVLDPILRAGGGSALGNSAYIQVLKETLIPLATLITPNSNEARQLTGKTNLDDCAEVLLKMGCRHVLITGTHEKHTQVIHRYYSHHHPATTFSYTRLPHTYHGSGCTLASACAALLAQDIPVLEALQQAQDYTYACLQHAFKIGQGQYHPNRFYWTYHD